MLVPVKSFADAKARLKSVLTDAEREQLARFTAERVIGAAGELPVFVACDSDIVADWAHAHGAGVLWRPGVGLDAAVNEGIDELRALGAQHVIVAHGDLPRAAHLADVATPGVLTLVPDSVDDGTNVAAVPTALAAALPFRFAYGAGSFRRHLAQALELGIPVCVRRDPMLAVDIDTPSDLAHPLVQEVLPTWLRTNPASPVR